MSASFMGGSYTNGNAVPITISGGTGSGATGTAEIISGLVQNITFTDGGTGYKNGDTLTITETATPANNNARFVVQSIFVTISGTNVTAYYSTGYTGLSVRLTVDLGGNISDHEIISGGSGYSYNSDAITLKNPENSSITAEFIIDEKTGSSYTIVDYQDSDNFENIGGSNYTGAKFIASGDTPSRWDNGSKLQIDNSTETTVATTKVDINATGSGFTVDYTTTGGKITSVSINGIGDNYIGGAIVTINGNEGSGTDARVEITDTGDSNTPPRGTIGRLEVVDGGVDYITPPKARIQSANGANAVIVPYGTDIGAIETVEVVLYGKADNTSTVIFRDTNAVNSNFTRAVGTVTYGALVNYDGYSLSNKSMLNNPESLLQDLEKYQKWSYAVRVSEDPSKWIGRVKELAHPAGMRVTAEYEMDSLMTSSSTVTTNTIVV